MEGSLVTGQSFRGVKTQEESKFGTMMKKKIQVYYPVFLSEHRYHVTSGMSTDGFEFISDTDSIEYTDNDSTGRPPPKNSGMEKNNNSKDSRIPWVKDIRNEGNKTLFGRSGIQIRGLRPSKSNITSESRPKRKKKKYNHILDSSDDSEDNSQAHENVKELSSSVHGNVKELSSSVHGNVKELSSSVHGNVKELNSSAHDTVKESTQDSATYNGKECRNSSSASTDCDDNSHFSVTTNKKHKQSKKKQSPPLKRISSSSSETDEYNWQVIKKHDWKKSGTSSKEASGIVIISSEAAESSSTDISVSSNNVGLDKRKRQLAGSGEASSRPSPTKKLKSILEESTKECSDSHWMSIKNVKKRGSDHGFKKRKSSHLEDSSSSESEDKKKCPSLKKNKNLVLPNITLKLCSSDEESGDILRQDLLNVKPLKKGNTVEEVVSDLDSPENDLPMLVRPRKRNNSSNSESSNRSASTVPYQLSDMGVKEDNNENSFPIEDPEYLSDAEVTPSEADSDVPLEEIMRKWSKSGTNEIEKIALIGDGISTKEETAQDNDSDTNHSESLFSQNQKPIDGKVQNESGELSYTKEEDYIFIADSDDDLYASMSQQNLTIDYDDNPTETENDEDQLARFFLGDQEEDKIDATIKAESPEHLLNFNWSKTPNKPEAVKEHKYDIQTQIQSVMKSERNDVYDADTQIILCDDFSDSDDERYGAETQIDGNCNADIKDEDEDYYYCAPTQPDVFQQNLKNTGNNFDRDTERSNAYYDARTQADSNVIQNKLPKRRSFDMDQSDDESDYDKETQVEKSHKTIEMKKCNRKDSMDYAPTQVDRTNKHSIVKRTSDDGPCTVEHTKVETVKVTKQFSSPDEARKYLEKVKSSTDDLFANDETQEYDWAEEKTILPKRKSVYSQNVKDVKKTVKAHEDVYDIMTQVKMDEKIKGREYSKQHKIKTPIKMDEKKQNLENEKRNDINTPIIKDRKLEEQEDEEETDDVEIIEIDDDDDDELYNAATQVESNLKSAKNEKSNDGKIHGRGMKQITCTSQVRVGVPQEVYNAMIQMELMPKKTNDVSEFYNADTQVVDKCQQQSDDECYIEETQNFSSDKQTGSDKEQKQIVNKTDNYIAQTQRVNEEEEMSQDCYNTMTQVASNIENITNNDTRNVFLALTQVENTVDSCENEELYTAETQVDNADIEHNTDESRDENSNANEANDESSEEYVCMLDEEESSEEKPESSYVPMLDDSPGEEESSLRSEEKKTPKQDQTYERHTLLKKISSNDRKAKFTSPQKQKSCKEIRESFKIGKEQFYSKPPQPKLDAKHVRNSDNIIIVEDDNWLSKQQKTRESNEKKNKKHSNKNVNVGNSLSMEEKIKEAKNRMAQREKQLAVQPRPVKRKRSVENDADASDVQPPDEKEILAKGLPLLEFPPVNNHQTDNSGKEMGERSHQYSEKDRDEKKDEKSERSTSKANNVDQQKSYDKYSKYKHDKKSSEKDKKSSDKDKNRKSTDKEKERKSTDREKNKKSTDREKDRKSTDREKNKKSTDSEKDRKSTDSEKDRKSGDKEKNRKSCDKEKDKKSMDKERDKRSSDKEKDRKSNDKDKKSRYKDKDRKSSDKDKKYSDKDKDRKSRDKIYIAKDKRIGERPSSKSTEKKDIKSHDKKDDKGKSSSKYSSKSSGHARSSHKDKDSGNLKNRDKENSDKDPASTMKKIPKLSEKAQLEKSQAATSKSPLISLDSEMSKGILSLIGISGNHSNTITQQIQDRSMQQQTTNGDMSNSSDYTKDTEVDNTIVKGKERDGNLTARTSSRETFPKSILRPVGAPRKGLNVKFTLPTYSQTEENKRLEQLATDFPKEKWAKNCFPEGKLPALPYQQNVPVSQQPLISAGGPIDVPHSSRSRPISAPNQHANILDEIVRTQQRLHADSQVRPNTNGDYNRQLGNQPMAGQQHQQITPYIPVPICKPGGSPTSDLSIIDINYFFIKILKWNASWFDEYEENKVTPPHIEESHPVKHLLESYNSYEDYFNILLPHLLLETWETCVRKWQENKSRQRCIDIAFTKVEKPNDRLFLYTFTALVPKHSNNLVNENDLVILNTWGINFWAQRSKQKVQYYPQLGFIERIKYHRHQESVDKIIQTFPSLVVPEGVAASSLIGLEISVKTRFRQFKMLPDKRSDIKVICSLVSTLRHYYALSHLYKTTLCENILKPGAIRVFHNHPTIREDDMVDLDEYNHSQKKAICVAAKLSLEPVQNRRICLIQGPPGTGKSHTIVGIIKRIFKKSNRQCRICLCAPSNAAVDELIKRLIIERRKMEDQSKQSGFNLVRIGSPENIHSDVYKYTYNEVVRANQAVELKKKMKGEVNSSTVQEINRLSDRIQVLEQELVDKTVTLQQFEARNIQSEITKLRKKKEDMEREIHAKYKNVRLTRDEEEKIRRDVLRRSHVVCGTLNSFGNHYYMNILSPYVNQARRSIFNCIIMDETSQATELDTLVPVQYGTTKLVMVGDPAQLPPTVLSQQSSNKSYGQSLFERFYNHFRFSECNPVLLLDTQYRMHPEIAEFPNKFMYSGNLKTDESIEKRCQKYDLRPYVLFDIQEGQELATQLGNITNSTEAEFIIELCEFLTEKTKLQQTDIGIISPYQQQKKIIKEGLTSRRLQKIEVNTVDGFQGREKEVIILTCTRAKSSSGGIGFLANKKRMNVALTRGRTALYVVGDLSSLRNGDLAWRTLIEDAETRQAICKVKANSNYYMLFNTCLSVNSRQGRQLIS